MVLVAGLAAVLGLANALAFVREGFDLSDEGFLWYGVQAVLRGELPLRDFQSYDPGRYAWCAAWSGWFGGGILGVRGAATLFQILGLVAGLLAARRATRSPVALLAVGLVLTGWMFPRHKLFEPAFAMMAVYAAVRLLESPTRAVTFGAGVFVGVAALFGRNLGLYAGCGLGTIALVQWLRLGVSGPDRLLAGAGGVLVGYLPMLGLLLLAPGFAEAFGESIRAQLREGANLPSPWLWPWRMTWSGIGAWQALSQVGLALHYLLPVVVLPLGCLALLRGDRERLPERRLLIASGVVGAFFVHHAAIRSGVLHLAQCLPPVLLGTLALLALVSRSRRAGLVAGTGAGLVSLATLLWVNPWWSRVHPEAPHPTLATFSAAGQELRIDEAEARFFQRLVTGIEATVPAGDALFVAPAAPGLYALLGRASPTWGLYFFWPDADRADQERLIRELDERNARWALVFEHALDGRKDLLFRNSNPLVWDTLTRAFQPVRGAPLPKGVQLFRRGPG